MVKKEPKSSIVDKRFEKIYSDPRFRVLAKKERKLQLDERFKSMFTDKDFQVSVPLKVDERGMEVDKVQNPLAHLYDVKQVDCIDEEGNFKWEVPSSSESEEEHNEVEERDMFVEPEPPTGDESFRIAVMNCDWNLIKAVDLLCIFKSFHPGVVKVSIYPSEFGKTRMEKEATSGPSLTSTSEFDEKALRQYELEQLKYYYAVIDCDSVETASKIYKECDGLEIERTSNTLDLRFIPDETVFPYPPTDVSSELPKNYKMLDYYTRALQHSRVTLSWDETPRDRVRAFRNAFAEEDIDDAELSKLIATPSPQSEPEEPLIEESMPSSYHKLSQFNRLQGNSADLEIKFHSAFDDIGESIAKDTGDHTVWEKHLIKKEKKKKIARDARKSEIKEQKQRKVDKKSMDNLKLLVDSKGDVPEFQLNPMDERFARLYTDSSYGIDPTSNNFKIDADGNRLLLNYQIKHRKRDH